MASKAEAADALLLEGAPPALQAAAHAASKGSPLLSTATRMLCVHRLLAAVTTAPPPPLAPGALVGKGKGDKVCAGGVNMS